MKALKEITRFSGDGNIEEWLDRFETAVSLDRDESREAELLIMRLEGAAYATWKGLLPADRYSVEKIKAALRRVFGESRYDAWSSFLSARAVTGEPLDVLANRISAWANVALAGGDPKDAACALVMMSALPAHVQDQVRMHVGQHPTLHQVVEAAKAIEVWKPACPALTVDEKGASGMIPRVANERHDTGALPVRSYHALPGARAARGHKGGSLGTRPTRNLRCFGCGQLGHFKRDCPLNCFACGNRGHLRKDCNNCPLNSSGGVQGEPAAPQL